jgi:hypothetical protein
MKKNKEKTRISTTQGSEEEEEALAAGRESGMDEGTMLVDG